MRGRAGPGRRGLLLVRRRQQRREQQRQDHHHRTRLLHLQRRQRGAELVQQAVRGGAPRRHRAADRGLLREPDHQGPAGRQRRRHAEPGPARQPERAAGRGDRPAPLAERPARLHHQRLLPRRHPGVHFPGQAVLLPDRHELGGSVLQQGHAQSGRPPAAHDLGRAGRRRQEADQAPGYGMAFDATADEQSTWQLEPFFWSNGASLTKVDTPPFQSSLQLWVNMVKDGSASKSVLNWGQDPDLTQQFIQGHAAMMVNGPWIFPELNQKGWKYNDQFGIVPIPTDKAGQTVVAPLGGETIDLGTGGSTEQQKLAWEWLQGMQQASTMEQVTSLMYYLPTKPAVTDRCSRAGRSTRSSPRKPRPPGRAPPSTAPTTRRCRRPSGPRSRPRSPAPRRGARRCRRPRARSPESNRSAAADLALAGQRPGRNRTRAAGRGLADPAPRGRRERDAPALPPTKRRHASGRISVASAIAMTGSGASGSPRPGVSSSRLPRYSPRCNTAWTSSPATARRPPCWAAPSTASSS